MEHKNKKHTLLMVLCCLVPLSIIFLLLALGVKVGPLGRFAPLAIFLICPLLHIGLLAFLFKGNNKNCCNSKNEASGQEL